MYIRMYAYVCLMWVVLLYICTYIVANSAGPKQCQILMSLILQEIKDDLSPAGM